MAVPADEPPRLCLYHPSLTRDPSWRSHQRSRSWGIFDDRTVLRAVVLLRDNNRAVSPESVMAVLRAGSGGIHRTRCMDLRHLTRTMQRLRTRFRAEAKTRFANGGNLDHVAERELYHLSEKAWPHLLAHVTRKARLHDLLEDSASSSSSPPPPARP